MVEWKDYQIDAIKKMHNGCILHGDVGSGKSLTSLGYYIYKVCNNWKTPKPLYIITTARKRDTKEWEAECDKLYINDHSIVRVDSWNNIEKYTNIYDSFFIFDEQRLVGTGAWYKAFQIISKKNEWILASATPGDKYEDYIAVFVANGFLKNKTEFIKNYCVLNPYVNYIQIQKYLRTDELDAWKDSILVDMDYIHEIDVINTNVWCSYDKEAYMKIISPPQGECRMNPYTENPIKNASEFCQTLRRLVNEDNSRRYAIEDLAKKIPKAIIFYNYNYEREILRTCNYGEGAIISEWNGEKHEPIPKSDRWYYLVQYTAGAEGWNCIETNTIIFYSLNYSWKIMAQSAGRVNRMNTPYTELYYYYLKSKSPIDKGIESKLKAKKEFNESRYYKKLMEKENTGSASETSKIRSQYSSKVFVENIEYNRERYRCTLPPIEEKNTPIKTNGYTFLDSDSKFINTNTPLPPIHEKSTPLKKNESLIKFKSESEFQSWLIKELHKRFEGCIVTKMDSSYLNGIPDLLILYNDKWALLEVKRCATASHRPNQDFFIARGKKMSYAAFIYPENAERILNELQTALRSTRPSCIS